MGRTHFWQIAEPRKRRRTECVTQLVRSEIAIYSEVKKAQCVFTIIKYITGIFSPRAL